MKNSYSLSDLKAFYSEDRAISKVRITLAIAEKILSAEFGEETKNLLEP
jgi:hypothetical protein